MTTLTSQYLFSEAQLYTDIARLGAQVIAGVGFIGAGTIIVTRRQRVKGLTTAAGLWVSAIIGLAVGSGFYSGAVFTTVLVLLAEVLFSKIEYQIVNTLPEVNLYIQYTDRNSLESVLTLFQGEKIKVLNLEITRASSDDESNACAIFNLRINKQTEIDNLLSRIKSIEGIHVANELY